MTKNTPGVQIVHMNPALVTRFCHRATNRHDNVMGCNLPIFPTSRSLHQGNIFFFMRKNIPTPASPKNIRMPITTPAIRPALKLKATYLKKKTKKNNNKKN